MHVLRREDPARNMARFYCLSLEPSLFGEILLVTQWGRQGTYGQRRMMSFADRKSASAALTRALSAKLRRGYEYRGFAPA